MTNKEIYKQLCEQADMPLFMQYWWLEGVCAGKDWDVLLVTQPADEADKQAEKSAADAADKAADAMPTVLAAMPYETGKKLWTRHVSQPVLCPYGGIWFHPSVIADADKIAALYRQISEQMAALKLMSFNQFFRHDCPSIHLLDDLGYKFVTRRTYILSDLSDLQRIIDGFSRSKRKKLEKLSLTFSISELEAEEFYYYHQATLAQKKDKPEYSRETLLVMAEKAAERNQIRIFGVRNQSGELMAAAVLVWDNRYAYLLLDTFDHDAPDSGARELLTLEAIKQARSAGVKFDFVKGRDYLKHYGAKKTTYYSVHKGAAPYVMWQRFMEWCKK